MQAHLYLPLSQNAELMITISRREYNGIDSDPKLLCHQPALLEVLGVVGKIGRFRFESQFSGLDLPESPARPGLAGGFTGAEAISAMSGGEVRILGDSRPFSEWPEFALPKAENFASGIDVSAGPVS